MRHGIWRMRFLLPMLLAALPALAAEPARLALVGGMLLDGYGGPPVHHAAILVENNRIVAVGPASEVRIPQGTPVIDTRGETMLPGLIEPHAHLIIVGDGDYPRWFKWLDAHKAQYPLSRIMALSARQMLAAGITSAVDLGAPLKESVEVRDQINRGALPGPRLSVSGPWLTSEPAIFPAYCQVEVHTAAQAAKATEANIKGGADVIKAHAGLNFEQYKAIVEVAHRYKVRVHAHVYDEKAVRDAFTAGVDVLQHVGSAGTPPYSAQLVREIAEAGRPVVPTAAHRVWLLPAMRAFPEYLDDPELARDFPPELWAEIHDSVQHFQTLDYFTDREQEEFFGDASLGQWIKGGAVIGIGTDNGTPLNFHRDALWREAKVFVDLGMPASRVITALTRTNARILGKDHELGTLEPGKLADIVVVRGSPLFDIMALSQVDVTVKDGIPYRHGEPVPARSAD